MYNKLLNEACSSLYNEASMISREYLANTYLASSSFPSLRHYFTSFQEITDVRILVTRPDSEIIIDSDKIYNCEGKYLNDYDDTLLSNQTVSETDLNHMLPEKAVAIIYPVTFSMEIIAYAVLTKPLQPIKNAAIRYIDTIVLCYIIFTSLLMLVMFYLYVQTALPIKTMTRAAKKYVAGQFNYPMGRITGNDQSELAGAIKYMAGKMSDMDNYQRKFIANVSHELKTPIALIQGYAEGLIEGMAEEKESRDYYCEVIMDEANKMNKMVRQLLTLNALESGNDLVSMERFNLVELIEGVLTATRILIEQKEGTCCRKPWGYL